MVHKKRAVRLVGLALLILMPVATRATLLYPHDRSLAFGMVIIGGLIHATLYTALLYGFAASLKPGHDPVVVSLARFARGGNLPDELAAYARRVTWAWCLFFAAQLLISLGLLLFASFQVWTIFLAAFNFPMLIAMLLGEYIYRLIRWRHYKHETMADMMRLFARARTLF